jgi:putative transcriptional regulator
MEVNTVKNRVREFRRKKGMTIRQLHEATGISMGHLSDIETGKHPPNVLFAARLALTLDTTVDELFPVTSDRPA